MSELTQLGLIGLLMLISIQLDVINRALARIGDGSRSEG